jgi:hypothetical protein
MEQLWRAILWETLILEWERLEKEIEVFDLTIPKRD